MIYVIGAIAFIAIIFLLLRKSGSAVEGNVKYTQAGDPEAQGKYFNIKFPPMLAISAKELLELSWKFLYDLTEAVLNKFSVRDQQSIMQHGRVMVEHGMKYQHVVDSNPKVIDSYRKKVTEQKPDTNAVQR